MSNANSQVSAASNATNRHKTKICAYCGKPAGADWSRHYSRQHKDMPKKEWIRGEALLDEPYCENWEEITIDPTIKPINIAPRYQKTVGSHISKKVSVTGSVRAPSDAGGDDYNVQMENIQEEHKADVAVPQFGAIEQITPKMPKSTRRSALGKRSPSKLPEDLILEDAVYQDLQESAPATIQVPQIKRSNIVESQLDRLSKENLKNIPLASVEQKRTPQVQDGFLVPLPVPQTVYVSQGMRDQEAIQKLRVLEQKRTGIMSVQVQELVKLAPFITQPMVSSFIEQSKIQLSRIRDLLLMAKSKLEDLSVEEITAVTFASMLFGGSCWEQLPKAFNSLEPSKLEDVLCSLRPLLVAKFNANLAQWICSNWRYLEGQTLLLIRYLKEERLGGDLVSNICTISTIVKMQDVYDYSVAAEGLLKYTTSKLVLDTIKSSAAQWTPESKLSFEEFAALVDFLSESSNKHLIQSKAKVLLELPLRQWLKRLTTLKEASQICDVSSVQYRLDELCRLYGPLSEKHKYDLCNSGIDERYKRTLHTVSNPSNQLQFANAQYAAFSLRDRSKQLWCIPSGQGKSRVLATIALILLLAGSTTKIHQVFDSQHLMERDQKEFESWWTLHSLQASVEYHVGLDFECKPGEIILIDEADELILPDPASFSAKIQHSKCICLTATPDNEDKQGMEREVLKLLGFSIFNGQPQTVVDPSTTDTIVTVQELKMDEILPFGPGPQLVTAIQQKLKESAVLCYCSLEFQELLVSAASVPPTIMRDGESIKDEYLRTLDSTDIHGLHALYIAPSSYGMRGFDYRAPRKGITLVIAASFANQRQAMQGLNRVGRFGDPCKRIGLKDIPLLDKQKELQYTANLMKFLNQNQKHKVTAHLPKEERKRQTTASNTITNTAKSTPAVSKSRKGQQNSSSQSTLTMLPQKDLTRRQTTLLAGAQVTEVKTKKQTKKPAKKQKDEAILFGDNDNEEERIEITESQMFDQNQEQQSLMSSP